MDFVDVNMGCPIDLVCKSGAGCALVDRAPKIQEIVTSMSGVSSFAGMAAALSTGGWSSLLVVAWLLAWLLALLRLTARVDTRRIPMRMRNIG